MTPADLKRNTERCAEILLRLNDPNWPNLSEQERADLAHELDALRYEKERQERIKFRGAA